MIEKITPDHILGLDGLPTTIMPDSAKLMRKINELVDAVNDLTTNLDGQARTLVEQQAKIAILEEHAHPTATTEPTYKNWIGKLCKFWNGENNKTVGVLMEVREIQNKVFFVDDIFCKYEHCEPVKQDDDIIYKGE